MTAPEHSPGANSGTSVAEPDFAEVTPARLALSVFLIALAADWLLYHAHAPGLALSIFVVVLGAVILWNRPAWTNDRGLCYAAPIAFLAVIQTAVAFSWINLLVLVTLLIFLSGTRFRLPWSQRWPGWFEAMAAWLKAPARWGWALSVLRNRRRATGDALYLRKSLRAGQILLPGLVLLFLFGILLGAGNALAGKYLVQAWEVLEESVRALARVSPLRLAFWAAMGTAALALCYPARCQLMSRASTAPWPRVSLSADHRVALWQTWISLAVVNALFLFVNTLDVFYLWMQTELPEGVGYSSFVHEGVYALIASTVLAGAVLAFFFQQSTDVTRSKLARALAIAWIAQNLLLLSGVALRLHLYIDAFGWSVLRFHVGSFLLLTAIGFGLLAVYIIKGMTLRRLILSNLTAVFCLFYLLQFANVHGWVARWNVERWMAGEGPELDVAYIESLDPPAWPALLAVAETGDRPEARCAREAIARARTAAIAAREDRTWRSWQWRREQWENRLLASQSQGIPNR